MTIGMRWMLALLAAVLVGCASTPPGAGLVGTGVVQSITEGTETDQAANVLGAIGGAALGAWLGSNIGGGTGQTIATAAGGVAGGMAGSSVASNAAGAKLFWDVRVRFEDGVDRVVRAYARPAFKPGDRVNVSNGVITLAR
jgi:outer membrane lipoprotein SlyB